MVEWMLSSCIQRTIRVSVGVSYRIVQVRYIGDANNTKKRSQSLGHPGQTGWGWLWLRCTGWDSAPILLAPLHSCTGTSENTCSPQYTSHTVGCCNWCSSRNQWSLHTPPEEFGEPIYKDSNYSTLAREIEASTSLVPRHSKNRRECMVCTVCACVAPQVFLRDLESFVKSTVILIMVCHSMKNALQKQWWESNETTHLFT